jgi:hypothetical protein
MRIPILASLVVVSSVTAFAAAPPDRAALEKLFAEKMTATALVGKFTVDGKEDQAREERYEISKTEKADGDDWIITARIKYGKYDVNVPITLQVFWAGDTPVITLTDLSIPGLGTFTARVMIYGDRYVGTWQHGKVGGHMFGRLEKSEPKAAPTDDKSDDKPE